MVRNQGIQQEHMQRSKIIDNEHQIALQNVLQQKQVDAVNQKHLKLVETTKQWLSDNRECEKVIFQEMNLPEDSGRTMLANAELKHILKPTVKLLKAFIFVQTHDKGDAAAGLSSKAKGKVKEAVEGADTLLRMAFDLRSQEVKLESIAGMQPQLPLTREQMYHLQNTWRLPSVLEPNQVFPIIILLSQKTLSRT